MALSFGDMLSNALHDIKRHRGKKISALQDEIGYAFDPSLTGDTIESWRYRKRPPTMAHLETLAQALVGYHAPPHDAQWLTTFLTSADHPYPQAICARLFPHAAEAVVPPAPVRFPPPPVTAYRPPSATGFVGRSDDLARYRARLEADGLALITGMAGMGKTSLAAVLAAEEPAPDRVFWHRFHPGDPAPLVRRLAGFLAHHGRADLWEALEAARTAGISPPDVTSSLDTLSAHLQGRRLLLCLDDLHYADDNPHLQAFVRRLAGTAGTELHLIITSRRTPLYLMAGHSDELAGLSPADTDALLTARQITLSPALVSRLHGATEGHAAFLTLASSALRRSPDPAGLIERLAEVDQIERFLLDEVHARLDDAEQAVMAVVALCGQAPVTRELIDELLQDLTPTDIRRALRTLTDQYLLTLTENVDRERVYSQHGILQSFYAELLPRGRRQALHRRAAGFLATEADEPFHAVGHYLQGQADEQAILLADRALWTMVNQGHAGALFSLLTGLTANDAALSTQVLLALTIGRLGAFLGEPAAARAALEKAAGLTELLPQDHEALDLSARIALATAILLERSDPKAARAQVDRGLDLAPVTDHARRAAFKVQGGTIDLYMGNLGGALEELHDGLDELARAPDAALEIRARKNLGLTHFRLGQLADAQRYTEQALTRSRAMGDHYQTAEILINAGPIRYVQGDWPGAIADLSAGLEWAQRLGARDAETALHVNLGGCYLPMARSDDAYAHLNRAVAMADEDDSQLAVIARIRLAELHNDGNRAEEALALLVQARSAAAAKNDQIALATITAAEAETRLLMDDAAHARELAEQALHGARTFGDRLGEGEFLRVLGRALAALGDQDRARTALERSLTILADEDRYEAARTQLELGRLALERGDQPQAREFLERTRRTFADLGATRELPTAETLLAALE